MLTNSLKISVTTKIEFIKLKFFQSDQENMTKLLPCRFQKCFGTFNMFTVHYCFGEGLFRHLSNTPFAVYNFVNPSPMKFIFFFQNVQNLMQISEIEKKIEKAYSIYVIIVFELVALNTYFYRERILVIRSQYANKQSQDFRYY